MKFKERQIKFRSRDGLRLRGTMRQPAGEPKAELLFVHGITSDRSEWGIFDLLATRLAEVGVLTLRFDFRGHGESELAEDRITLSGILSDAIAALEVLSSRDGSRDRRYKRYIMGSSFGGGVAYAAAARAGDINRVFLLAPVFDYLADLNNCAPKWEMQLRRGDTFKYADMRLGRPLLNEALYFQPLELGKVPTTVFHGTDDSDVPFELSAAVANHCRHIDLVPVKGAGHVLAVPGDLDMDLPQSWSYVNYMVEQVLSRVED